VIPAVGRLANEWQTGRVVRLNMVSEVNKKYAEGLGVIDTPTFILFDAFGQEQRRWAQEPPELAELPH
jgi:hypothetical protein